MKVPGYVKAGTTYTIDRTHTFRSGDYGAGLAAMSERGETQGEFFMLRTQTETEAIWEYRWPK